jgi:hypothetical protein
MYSGVNGLFRLAGVGAAILLSSLFASSAGAQSCGAPPCSFEGVSTPMTSTADREISFRNEQHSWQTPDGLTHFLINIGSGAQQGLQIWSLYIDSSKVDHWVAGPFIPDSGQTSTGDGRLLVNNSAVSLAVVYSTYVTGSNNQPLDGGNIAYMLLDYTPQQGAAAGTTTGWLLDGTVNNSSALRSVYTPASGFYAINPTLAIDTTSASTMWVSYSLSQCQVSPSAVCPPTSSIKLSYLGKVSGNSPKWLDSGLSFGATDGNFDYVERSSRLIATANAVGMIYQVHQSYFWTYRVNGSLPTSPWSAPQPFFSSAPSPNSNNPGTPYDFNPYASHYSALSDTDNPAYIPGGSEPKVHLVTVDHQRLLYQGYGANQSGSWSTPQVLMQANAGLGTPNQATLATYPQLFFAPKMNAPSGQYLGALVNNTDAGAVYQSTDNGQTWSGAAILKHDNASPTASFLNPRFEVPEAITTPDVPLVQQYVDPSGSSSNFLLLFDLTGLVN